MRSTVTPEEVEQWAARAAAERTWPDQLEAHIRSMETHGLAVVTVQQALDEIAGQL